MTATFTVRDWSAFAPGLADKAAWQAWAAEPRLPQGEAVPTLAEMPPMQRRRVDTLGRMALQVAWWCQQAADGEVPLVFASRHGDLGRSYEMLQALARGEPQSPTHFGLSTHNAIAAQYGIARKLEGNCVCVAAGRASAEAAVVEALGLLADGAGEVLVVVYDTPLPAGYATFGDEPEAPYAWAARLSRGAPDEAAFELRVDAPGTGPDPGTDAALPHGLDVLRFLIGTSPSLEYRDQGRAWRWLRHA